MADREAAPRRLRRGLAGTAVVLMGLTVCGCGSSRGHRPPAVTPLASVVAAPRARPADGRQGHAHLWLNALARTASVRSTSPGTVRFTDIDYHAIVANSGSRVAFTMFATTASRFVIRPDSSGTVTESVTKTARFASPVDRTHWIAAGAFPVPQSTLQSASAAIPAGAYSFTPQGAPFTFADATDVRPSAATIHAQVAARMPARSAVNQAFTLLRQYAFLLGTAPLRRAVVAAVLRAIGQVPGIRSCGETTDVVGRLGESVCVTGQPTSLQVVLDPKSGRTLAVIERVAQRSPYYPDVPVGAVVQADTFLRK